MVSVITGTAVRHGRNAQPSPLLWRVGFRIDIFGACTVFTLVTARTPRFPPYRGVFLKCFRPFVASWPAPSASGRSESGQVGISPTGLVCLCQGTHNNYIENLIRPFSQGRRVALFANNPLGARASANLYSLVATARANGIEPGAYLNFLFENLPAAETVEALEALLPWNARSSLPATRRAA